MSSAQTMQWAQQGSGASLLRPEAVERPVSVQTIGNTGSTASVWPFSQTRISERYVAPPARQLLDLQDPQAFRFQAFDAGKTVRREPAAEGWSAAARAVGQGAGAELGLVLPAASEPGLWQAPQRMGAIVRPYANDGTSYERQFAAQQQSQQARAMPDMATRTRAQVNAQQLDERNAPGVQARVGVDMGSVQARVRRDDNVQVLVPDWRIASHPAMDKVAEAQVPVWQWGRK
jgi:hypothetical protein